MVTVFRDRSRLQFILLAIALSLAITLLGPALAGAQELPSVTATVDPVAAMQPTALATAAATADASARAATNPATDGGASNADAMLVGTFTTATVLVLAGLAILDRKPETE